VDIRQVEEQLASILASAAFGDTPYEAILTEVLVTRQDLGALLVAWSSKAALQCPFGVVRVKRGTAERDVATHASGSMGRGMRQTFRATVVVVAGSIVDPLPSPPPFRAVGNVASDNVHGQGGILGLAAAIGTRTNQGVDRIEAEVLRALGNGFLVDQVHGVAGKLLGSGDLMTAYGVQLLGRAFELEITNGSVEETYHQPIRLHVSSLAGTTATLAWTPVPTRPDFLSYVLSRNNVPVYTGTNTSYADATGAHATYSYSLVAQYDDVTRPPATANRTSKATTLSVTV
jgi:hypothetical protein